MSLFVHVLGSITTVDRIGVLHAAPEGAQWSLVSTRKHPRVRRTIPSVCGMKRTRPVGLQLVNPDGSDAGVTTLLWPPRLSGLKEGNARCQECYVATGRPRPNPSWDQATHALVGVTAGGAA